MAIKRDTVRWGRGGGVVERWVVEIPVQGYFGMVDKPYIILGYVLVQGIGIK